MTLQILVYSLAPFNQYMQRRELGQTAKTEITLQYAAVTLHIRFKI